MLNIWWKEIVVTVRHHRISIKVSVQQRHMRMCTSTVLQKSLWMILSRIIGVHCRTMIIHPHTHTHTHTHIYIYIYIHTITNRPAEVYSRIWETAPYSMMKYVCHRHPCMYVSVAPQRIQWITVIRTTNWYRKKSIFLYKICYQKEIHNSIFLKQKKLI
jgi:hypothetical protein